MSADTLIADLREKLAKATPGPWRERDGYYRSIQGSPVNGAAYGDMVTTHTGQIAAQQGQGKHNSTLIVAAVNGLPGLLDRIEALEAALRDIHAAATLAALLADGDDDDAWRMVRDRSASALATQPTVKEEGK